MTPPVFQYTHDEGCWVTGGFVYRGTAIPEIAGQYFFGDWCNGSIRSFRLVAGTAVDAVDWTADLAEVGRVTSFGLDNDLEMYTVNWDGQLFKIVPIR